MISGFHIEASPSARRDGRPRRLSLVFALIFGLLTSLFHCGSCDLAFAGSDTAAVVMDLDGGATPDAADHKMPAHCGHCLNHVTGQSIFAANLPAEVSHQLRRTGRDQAPPSLAGLPLFKPPRA